MTPERRGFLYMPFEHSEDLRDQRQSLLLFTALGDAEQLDYARKHHEVIERFGRFPHRNAILGRKPTAIEAAAATWCPGNGPRRARPILQLFEASLVRARLEAEDIASVLFDTEMNWGGLDGVVPVRLMVDEDDLPRRGGSRRGLVALAFGFSQGRIGRRL